MPSFLEIFFEVCSECTEWTYQRGSRNRWLSVPCSRATPSHQVLTPRQSLTPASSCRPLSPSVSDPSIAVRLRDNGEGVSLDSIEFNPDQTDNNGWTTVETVVIRFNTGYTPSGHFPVYSNQSDLITHWTRDEVGYDAAVCVQKYEPWIIESYNTLITSPSTLRIVEKGDGGTPVSPSGKIRGTPISNTRYLNATGKQFAFSVAHGNGIYQITKDDAEGRNYLPSPTASPVLPLRTKFPLTPPYSTGRVFWHHK